MSCFSLSINTVVTVLCRVIHHLTILQYVQFEAFIADIRMKYYKVQVQHLGN